MDILPIFDTGEPSTGELRKSVKEILKNRKGKDFAITVEKIAKIMGVKDNGLTNPLLRSKIRDIIDALEMPVGSCSKGYYIIITDMELLEYCTNLDNRIKGMKTRKANVIKAYNKSKGK